MPPTAGEVEDVEQLQMLVSLCRDFVGGVVRPFVEQNRELSGTVPLTEGDTGALIRAADDVGLRGLGVPESFGGTPLDVMTQVACVEELAQGDPGFALNLGHNWALTQLVASGSGEAARGTALSRYMQTPDLLVTCAPDQLARAAEPTIDRARFEARDEHVPGLAAVPADGGWVVDGVQPSVVSGASAGLFVLAADAIEDEGSVRGVLLLVPGDAEGVKVSERWTQVGDDLLATADLTFEAVRLSGDAVVAIDATVIDALRGYVRTSLVLESAAALGIAQRTFDASRRHVQERVQGGKVIVNYPALAQLIASMATTLETIRALTYRAARAVADDRADAAALPVMARLQSAEAACAVARWSVEAYGGSGVMREMGIEKHYRDAVALRNGVSRDAQRFAIAKALLPAAPDRYGGPETALDLLTA